MVHPMKTNPLLEELWRVKDDLAREAGYDIDRIFAELRAEEAQYPGAMLCSAEDLRHHAAELEARQSEPSSLALSETPPAT